MRIPPETVAAIKDRARIEEVVGDYVSLVRKGDRLWGLSPFKVEKTPSFSVNPARNAYFCFSTAKGGGAVDFIMEMEHLGYVEALHFLARKYGIDIVAGEEGVSEEYRNRKALEELYRKLSLTLSHILKENPQGEAARGYLLSRGISDESVRAFGLGFMPKGDWLYNFLTGKGYTPDFLAGAGLFSRKSPRFCIFSGRLMFPICDITGNVIAFGGRTMESEGQPKYINSPETPIYHKGTTVYGLHLAKDRIRKEDRSLICEGYMDVIALHQAGVSNAVAPLGTAFTPEQARVLKRLGAGISLLFDNDQAGRAATEKAFLLAEETELECDVVRLDGAKDPADILLKDGSQALHKMVSCRVNVLEYLLGEVSSGGVGAVPGDLSRTVKRVAPFLQAIKSPVRREQSMRILADCLGVSFEALSGELQRPDRHAAAPEPSGVSVRKVQRGVVEGDLLDFRIMLAVALNSQIFPSLRGDLRLEDLRDERARELYISLEEAYRDGVLGTDDVVAKIRDEDLRGIVLRKQVEGEFSLHAGQFVRTGLLRIRERNLLERRASVTSQIRKLARGAEPDPVLERELLEETLVIDEAVKELRKQIDDRSAE